MIGQLTDHLGNFLTFQEDSLWNSAVFDLGFRDENGLIGEVIVDFDFPNAVILEPTLDNMLLEVCIEPQHLTIILDPRRLHPRDRLILGLPPLLLEAQIRDTLSQLINEIKIDILSNILSLLLLAVVGVDELLSLVEVLLVRVVEDVAGQEGDLLWQVCLHLSVVFYLVR